MLYKFVIVLAILLLYPTTIESNRRRFKLEIFNFTCTNLTTRLKRFDCEIQKTSSNAEYVLSQRVMFDRKMEKNFHVRISIQIRPQNSKSSYTFVNVKLNVCDSLAQPLQNRLLHGLLNELKRSSNIPLSCPFKENVLYKMDNFSVRGEDLPPYTPLLNFTYTLEFLEGNTVFGIATTMGATNRK